MPYQGELCSRRVYVIDDEPTVRASIVDLLDSAGIDTTSYDSSEGFLHNYSRDAEPVQCIVADYRMPGLNGLELKRELNARASDVPVILLTGYRDDDTESRAEELGVYAVLEKPFPPADLLRLAQSALRQTEKDAT